MNIVFIVPTGIGAEIGGHAGDATPAAKLISSVCDRLIIHPNVVNASDINEMTPNMMYVEGSMLDRFLEGKIGLEEVYQNKILLITNPPVTIDTINAVSGARATIGADIEIVELKHPIEMIAELGKDGRATGTVSHMLEAIEQISEYNFDVLIVNTPITTQDEQVTDYLSHDGGTNIWGGVEAKLSAIMSERLGKPVIHAPVESNEAFKAFVGVVDPRKAAELVSVCYLHCCLKGAHTAPKIDMADEAFWNTDIEFMISPASIWGRPHRACAKADIPIIMVRNNTTIFDLPIPTSANTIFVHNYLEAVGVISAREAGISIDSIKRPLEPTIVHKVIND